MKRRSSSARDRGRYPRRQAPNASVQGFDCRHCGIWVPAGGAGTEHRNHCPNCLHSQHLDNDPGDREAECGGTMEPVTVWVRRGGEWALIHRCRVCGAFSSNRIAADDNPIVLVSLATRPLAMPAFPLEQLGRVHKVPPEDGD
ncbi:MAG: RNHCP domain-containing protein [Armatimonadetes bacterium]|nr:RNHCP domain-containing protein [Armatimonadota bacterium]